jgi:hypothetical protein
MTMRMLKTIGLLAAVAGSVSCGDVARTGRSPVYLVISQLQAARGGGSTANQFSGTLQSDVLTLVTSPAPCSPATPCPTIFADPGFVVLRISPKDIGTGIVPPQPSLTNEVTITRYRVVYKRADGRNTPGVDVPYGFDGAMTTTIPTGGATTSTFELVRHISKQESPLIELVLNPNIISTIAEITFYGHDQAGNEISATGLMTIDFGNFGD